jgi:DNA polymerase-1
VESFYTACRKESLDESKLLSPTVVLTIRDEKLTVSLRTRCQVFSLTQGMELVRRLLCAEFDVSLVTLDASELMFQYFQSIPSEANRLFHSTRLMDLVVPSWMLAPDTSACCVDSLRLRYGLPEVDFAAIHRHLLADLGSKRMLRQYKDIERHIPLQLAQMRFHGFRIDTDRLQTHLSTVAKELQRLKGEAAAETWDEFNIQSPDDCRTALFDVLHLDEKLKSTGGRKESVALTGNGRYSTNEETLLKLHEFHPLPGLILRYRKWKVAGAQMDGLLTHCIDGVVRSHFSQTGTESGRLTSSEPNLQNLSRHSDAVEMPSIRQCLVAPPDCSLITLDYEQIELRILAHLSGDQKLREHLSTGVDIHREIAAKVNGKVPNEVTAEERTAAKRTVFGTLYGMSPATLAAELRQPIELAYQVQSTFRHVYPRIEQFRQSVIEDCRRSSSKSVTTLLGRLRFLPDIDSPDFTLRSSAERQAFNTVIQGSAADVVKRAMIDIALAQQVDPCEPCLRQARLICQIHDELIFATPSPLAIPLGQKIGSLMSNAMQLTVPFPVKLRVGVSLAEVREL